MSCSTHFMQIKKPILKVLVTVLKRMFKLKVFGDSCMSKLEKHFQRTSLINLFVDLLGQIEKLCNVGYFQHTRGELLV